MKYSELCEVYKQLESTTKRLEKTEILESFLEKLKKEKNIEIIYLLRGKIFPDYDEREIGISSQLAIKALSKATGISTNEIVKKWKELGDLGDVAFELIEKKKQSTFFSQKLTCEKVLENLQKLPELEGKGTVEKKLSLIVELMINSSPLESKYLIRTLLSDLRIGVGDGTLRDAIVWVCFGKENEDQKQIVEIVQEAYDKATDFALIFEKACKNLKELEKITLIPGKPIKVMLALKAKDVEDGFERVGKPAAFEYKYDGFRLIITKDEKENINLFTRRLDNVSKQFPDVVEYVKKYVKAKSFVIDAEVVGYDPKTKKYVPFQNISQRIKRKYDIDQMAKTLPVEVNVFDIVYYNGENLIKTEYEKRRKILEKIVKPKKMELKLTEQIITDSEEKAEEFYNKALNEGEEGLMIKNLKAPYKPGGRVGYMLKLKPEDREFDLVIIGGEYGTGKRAGWLSSYYVACRDRDSEKFLDIGKVSTGLKEKKEEGLSFEELSDKLKKLITKEDGKTVFVKPKIVVTVVYQNIQKSPKYSSGFALRFPRITQLRVDRNVEDIATLDEIKKEFEK